MAAVPVTLWALVHGSAAALSCPHSPRTGSPPSTGTHRGCIHPSPLPGLPREQGPRDAGAQPAALAGGGTLPPHQPPDLVPERHYLPAGRGPGLPAARWVPAACCPSPRPTSAWDGHTLPGPTPGLGSGLFACPGISDRVPPLSPLCPPGSLQTRTTSTPGRASPCPLTSWISAITTTRR